MASSTSMKGEGAMPTLTPLAVVIALIEQLPECIQTAGLQAVTTNGCNGNQACNCQDDTFLRLMEDTIEHNCTAADAQTTLTLSNILCSSAVPDLEHNRDTLIIAVYTVLMTLTAISVILRIYSRKKAGLRLWWDDYLVVLGLLFTYGLTIDGLVGLSVGFGHHILTLGYYVIIDFGKMFWAGQLIFVLAITTIKISILFFYLRIFPGQRFRAVVICIGIMQLAWCLSFFCAIVFSCTPIHYFWYKVGPYGNGYCINNIAMLYAATGTNFIADFSVWCLPIAPLWALQMHLSRKLAIISIFLLGGFVCLSAIIRFPLLSKINEVDITWTSVDAGVWIVVECNMGIVCACIPILGPCFKALSTSSPIARLRGRSSVYSETLSGKSAVHETEPLPPSPGGLDEEYDMAEAYYGADVNGSIERILRLGHIWELDGRITSTRSK